MIWGPGRIRRALGCVAGAALVGIPIGLIALQIIYWFSYDGQEIVLVIVLPLCLGLGVAIGYDLAATGQSRGPTQILIGSLALIALILLGMLDGALLIPLTQTYSPAAAIETEIAIACAVFGLTAAAMITRWHVDNATLAAPLSAVLGVLYVASYIGSYRVIDSLTFHCPPGARCAMITWQLFLPSDFAQIALPVGIWLGLTLWAALALARRTAGLQPAPVTS